MYADSVHFVEQQRPINNKLLRQCLWLVLELLEVLLSLKMRKPPNKSISREKYFANLPRKKLPNLTHDMTHIGDCTLESLRKWRFSDTGRKLEGNISHARTVVPQIFKLIVSTRKKILNNVLVWRKLNRNTAHFALLFVAQKRRLLKFPFVFIAGLYKQNEVEW